ncbi:TRAP transporter substrate-binding protein DctP [Tropicibacter sp. R15_0]|uniref:TRAP transporter substrate-binding protein DctP n=1 Tax=Tropicibacter sp. R15_0 TaxID=2821101 RepID=UPI001ADCC4C2|nr:TRAP transporter substrate-binding protein DctP [Tropicibacter sp. R15_0]MBO9464224.1 TRAP transporter substrate-binding protein DctP [Tropicibacter sp. R15_0]
MPQMRDMKFLSLGPVIYFSIIALAGSILDQMRGTRSFGRKFMFNSLRNLAVAGSVMAMSAMFANTVQAADELVISSATPPQHIQTLTMARFAEALMERSGGTLKAKVFDSSQLYNARDVGKAVARGDVGMATVPSPYLSRVESNINVLDLPVLKGMTAQERAKMLDGPLGDKLSEMLHAKMGVVVPGNWPILGRVYYWSTSKPLTNFEEFVGLQVRIPGGAGPAALVEGMGGVPVVMPGSDMPLALQQGTVDATMAAIESVVQQKLTDVGVRYGFWDQGVVGFLIPIVSQAYWDSLSDDEKTLFTEVWNDVVAEQRVANLAVDAEMRATLKDWGVTISDADDASSAAMREKMMPQQEAVIAKYKLDADLVALATEAAAQ